MNPKISVIIANYNNAKYLEDCLKSVLTQDFSAWECIIVDDGSTDKSKKIISEFAKRDKRFRPIFQENRGASATRNRGLDAARGDYISFLDSDDCFTAGALSLLYNLAIQNNADIVGGGGVSVYDDFKLVSATSGNFANPPFNIFGTNAADLIKMTELDETHRMVWVWRRLFRRQTIGGVRFYEDLFPGEDTCFIFQVLPNAARIVESRAMVVYHRNSNTSVSRATFNQKSFSYLTPTLQRLRQIMDSGYPPLYQNYFYKKYMDLVMNEIVLKPIFFGRLCRQAAAHLKPVYRTRALPLKHLPFLRRIIFWLFMKVFG
ncbi:MAG: glycosyltransferase [Rickettsiales bacterium]|nr:glycosyltransferase [Rickettsiales bacterium]